MRRQRRLAQAELAALAGLSQRQVSRLERGERRGRRATWRRLADALGLPVDVLRGRPEKP